MNYEFPHIVHISQVLDAIKGDEDLFYIVEKDGYTVVNYKLPCNKTFPPVVDRNTAIRRELRGIKFDNVTGQTIARPYQKFHNAGEREETLLPNIDISKPYRRLEKLDGSMIHPLHLGPSGFRFSTKMGVTDTSMKTEVWLAKKNPEGLIDFIHDCRAKNLTTIFEWCSRDNRIVVDYPVDRLVLTAIRDTYTGEYETYESMENYASLFDLDLVKTVGDSISSMEEYVNSIHEKQGDLDEGEVLRFDTGHMVKVKRKDYLNLHKTKDKIQKERNLVAVMLSGGLDDLKPFMLAEDLVKAEIYETKLNANVSEFCDKVLNKLNFISINDIDRKTFALNDDSNQLVKQIVFQLWDKNFEADDGTIFDLVMKKFVDACESDQKFDRIKPVLLKGCEW